MGRGSSQSSAVAAASMPRRRDYADAHAFRAALEARLNEQARRQPQFTATRLRKQVAFERFLARMVAARPDGWALKGAMALDIRLGDRARSTNDVDLGFASADQDEMMELMLSARDCDLDDFFAFAVKRMTTKNPNAANPAGRFHVSATLDNRRFEEFSIDVGYSDLLLWNPERLDGPGHLTFAGVAPAQIPVIHVEQHLAEKLHAYTRQHPSGPSMRPKDLVDMVLIAQGFVPVDARRLREACQATFTERATHELPAKLPKPPAAWKTPFSKLARQVGIPDSTAKAHRIAAAFFNEVLAGDGDGVWDAATQTWRPAES